MKNYSKLFFSIFFVIAALNVKGQIKFGLKAGLNLSTETLKAQGVSIDTKYLVGYNLGIISEIPLKDKFVLQPGIVFSTKGSNYTIDGIDRTIAPNYIDLPINLLYKIELSQTRLLLFAGPYFSYGIGGKFKTPDYTRDIHFVPSINSDMKRFDFGLNFGVGLEINKFQISAQYGLGLLNLAPTEAADAVLKNYVIGFTLAYLFGVK